MPDGSLLQHDLPVVLPDHAGGPVAGSSGEDIKLECSPGLNLVRAECSNCCIHTFVEKHSVKKVDKVDELVGETSNFCMYSVAVVANTRVLTNFPGKEHDDIGFITGRIERLLET